MKILTSKQQNEILKKLCANEIIFNHLTSTFPNGNDDEWFDCMGTYIHNAVDIAIMVGGLNGALKVKNTLDKKCEQLKEQKNEQSL